MKWFWAMVLVLVPVQLYAQELSLTYKEVYEPYEKIILEANLGNIPDTHTAAVLWNVVSEDVDFEQVGDNLHVWAPPGKHLIFINKITIEKSTSQIATKVERITFRVSGTKPDDPVDPDKPDDPVDPVDPDDPVTDFDQFKTLIPQWASNVDPGGDKSQQAKALAEAFRKHGAKASSYSSAKELTEATSAEYRPALGLNDYLVWRSAVIVPLITKINELYADGQVKSLDDYGTIWLVVADGFDKVK